ncbi:hypothetical protein GWI33_012554 [Rhynchophorus ferrugineus]|uniref:DUF4455 domain-containing protein n=1 Tax=Rhynchophorus ferrugineus TaxID=354439 RepID=A0A834MCC9_RHYFE|nr:hypothetical protein GWI33_012554 [Rhynchophorus ferrugineus]
MDDDICYLPDNFVGQSRPSRIIERLYEKRKQEEQKTINNLNATKTEIITHYNDIAKSQIDSLQQELNEIQLCIKDELFECRMRANKESFEVIKKEYFEKVHKIIEEYTKKQLLLIDKWHHNQEDLEQAKSKKLKDALKIAYDSIKTISYSLPCEYNEFIEMQLEKINQELLCNRRTQNEMKTHLKLEIQNDLKNFIEELRRIKACWINYVKEKTAKSVSSKTHQTLEDILNSKKCLSPDDEKELKDITDGVKNALTVECITNVPTAEEWLRKLRLTLGMLDQSAQKLIQSFKRATVIFFNRFFEELKCVYETLTEMDEDEVSSIQCEMYTPTIEEMRDIYNNKLDLVQQIWNDLIKDMSKTVDHTYKFLIAGSTLFEKHFRRLTVLQLMVQKDISNVIIGNNRVLEMYGLKLNVLLDTLRQEPTEDKVNKTFEEIKKHLNSMDELCRTQFQAETTTTKKYTTYLDQALDILIAELNRFLVIYPPDMEKDPKIQRKRASRTSEMADPNEDLIPNQIWYCKFEVDAVTNWGFGLWESIRTYVQTAKSELQKDGEKWINDEIQTLEHRLEIRLNITKIKYAKIQAYIYEERLKELDIHKSRLEEHKRAIEKTLQAIKDQFNQHQEQYTQIFEQYNLTAYITVLHAKLENGKEECENVYSKYVKEVGRIFNEIKSKNIMFIKHMRLFSENGNFNPLESKEYIKHLTKLEGQCEKDISSIEKTSQTAKTSIMTDMETRHSEVMDTLKTIREEYLFAEKVEKKLQCLRKDVDTKLDSEKSNFNDLCITIKHLEEDAKSGCGNFKYFDVFDLISNEISQKAESLALYLDHPVPLILYSDKSNIETNDTKLQTKKIEDHISTYHAKLFNFSLESQRATFLTDLHIIILNCWNDLSEQAKVKIFYVVDKNFVVGIDTQYNEYRKLRKMSATRVFSLIEG